MAKINATYGAGYYIDPSANYLQVEASQRRERRFNPKEKDQVMRQTFAAPFTIVCLHCHARTARGTHHYVNRKKTGDKYLGMPVWELEFRCHACQKHFALVTDLETAKLTGGYKCLRHCERPEGDFLSRNVTNEKLVSERKGEKEQEILGQQGDLKALDEHNDRVEMLMAMDRAIEARVQAAAMANTTEEADNVESSDDSFSTSTSECAQSTSQLTRKLLEGVRKRNRECCDEAATDAALLDDGDEEFLLFQQALANATQLSENRDQMQNVSSSGVAASAAVGLPSLEHTNPFDVLDDMASLQGPNVGTQDAPMALVTKKKGATLLSRFGC